MKVGSLTCRDANFGKVFFIKKADAFFCVYIPYPKPKKNFVGIPFFATFVANMFCMQIVSFEHIKALYPNEWVLIGNPELDEPEMEASIVSQLLAGILLFHSKDRREMAVKGRELKKGFESTTCVYTGEIPTGRKFWL